MARAIAKLSPKAVQRIGLAAVVLLAPGGFVLGAGLAVRWWQRARAAR
ncbi:hypothetical protein [Sphingomonas sp.]